mmetsp:Transcript_6098/g.10633  ORF Transcript_6098/g.10633 Transcript_6098/m.10633 type:complete len:207 (+) Transcript_6098:47-667(+)
MYNPFLPFPSWGKEAGIKNTTNTAFSVIWPWPLWVEASWPTMIYFPSIHHHHHPQQPLLLMLILMMMMMPSLLSIKRQKTRRAGSHLFAVEAPVHGNVLRKLSSGWHSLNHLPRTARVGVICSRSCTCLEPYPTTAANKSGMKSRDTRNSEKLPIPVSIPNPNGLFIFHTLMSTKPTTPFGYDPNWLCLYFNNTHPFANPTNHLCR